MMQPTRAFVKRLLPPVLVDVYKAWKSTYSFAGNYATWEAAIRDCSGYDDPQLIEHIRESVVRVLEGKAAFERDGSVFAQHEYDWRFLSGLLLAASLAGGKLAVVDVGGSLGSTYMQYRSFLQHLKSVRWTVVEQPEVVRASSGLFPEGEVRFEESLPKALRSARPNVTLLCSVLQYVRDPYALLAEVLAGPSPVVLIDRTAVRKGPDRLTVQRNGPSHLNSSYPAWFLDETRLWREILKSHEIVFEYPALESTVHSGVPGAHDIGLVCLKREAANS